LVRVGDLYLAFRSALVDIYVVRATSGRIRARGPKSWCHYSC
jgi:hypothetical protein